jgi:hypothetical protein
MDDVYTRWPFTSHVEVAQRAPEVPYVPPEFPYVEPQYLKCSYCDEVIEYDEIAISLIIGRVGRGQKSGRPMILDDKELTNPIPDLHLDCLPSYAMEENLCEGWDYDEGEICRGCGSGVRVGGADYCPFCGAELHERE